MRTLAELAVGHSATVLEVIGDDSISIRLMEMGITEGEQVSLVGRAPFGDPLEIKVRGYRLSVRSVEAKRVAISTLAEQ